jgi:hypoxanthine phosphoribosyltransferase
LKITSQRARDIFDAAEEICPAANVNAAVSRVAAELNASIGDADPLIIVVLRGAMVFAGQLLPQLTFPLDVDSVDATRYGDTTCGGDMVFRTLPVSDVAGRTVLLLDDILDEGITLNAIRNRLLSMQAREVKIAVFANKQTGKPKPLAADYVGVMLPDRYVFGFGMDIHGYWRNLPSIYAVNEKG